MIPLRFTEADAIRANEEWRCNCGPAAIAAIMGLSLDEVRPHLSDFEQRGYMPTSMMWFVLNRLGAKLDKKNFNPVTRRDRDGNPPAWPRWGIARIQWEGPWLKPGVPMNVRSLYTHWVGSCSLLQATHVGIFDINCMETGGWVSVSDWTGKVVELPELPISAREPARGGSRP